jgi:hypothetical protein
VREAAWWKPLRIEFAAVSKKTSQKANLFPPMNRQTYVKPETEIKPRMNTNRHEFRSIDVFTWRVSSIHDLDSCLLVSICGFFSLNPTAGLRVNTPWHRSSRREENGIPQIAGMGPTNLSWGGLWSLRQVLDWASPLALSEVVACPKAVESYRSRRRCRAILGSLSLSTPFVGRLTCSPGICFCARRLLRGPRMGQSKAPGKTAVDAVIRHALQAVALDAQRDVHACPGAEMTSESEA